MLSAGVLGGALAVALTSASFDMPDRTSAQAGGPAVQHPLTAALAPASTHRAETMSPRVFVFYVVDSPTRQNEIEMALQSDTSFHGQNNFQPRILTFHDFLLVQTPEEEAETMEFLRDMVDVGPMEGFHVRVVDLR